MISEKKNAIKVASGSFSPKIIIPLVPRAVPARAFVFTHTFFHEMFQDNLGQNGWGTLSLNPSLPQYQNEHQEV